MTAARVSGLRAKSLTSRFKLKSRSTRRQARSLTYRYQLKRLDNFSNPLSYAQPSPISVLGMAATQPAMTADVTTITSVVELGVVATQPTITPDVTVTVDNASLGASATQPTMTPMSEDTAYPAASSLGLVSTEPVLTADAGTTTTAAAALGMTAAEPAVTATITTTTAAASLGMTATEPTATATVTTTTAVAGLGLSTSAPVVTPAVTTVTASASAGLTVTEPSVIASGTGAAPEDALLGMVSTQPAMTADVATDTAAASFGLLVTQPAVTATVTAAVDAASLGLVATQPSVTAAVTTTTAEASLGLESTQPAVTADVATSTAAASLGLGSTQPSVSFANTAVVDSASLGFSASSPANTAAVTTTTASASLGAQATQPTMTPSGGATNNIYFVDQVWTRQPPAHTPINRNHRLAKGLKIAIHHADVGSSTRDLMGQMPSTDAFVEGSPQFGKTAPVGQGMFVSNRTTRTGINYGAASENVVDFSGPNTVFHYGIFDNPAADSDEFTLSSRLDTSTTKALANAASTTPDDQKPHTWAATWDAPSPLIVYEDGVEIGRDSTVSTPVGSYAFRYDNNSNRWEVYLGPGGAESLRIGTSYTGKTTDQWDGWIFLTFIWERALSPTELLSLNKNPWQMFEPRRIVTFK